MKKIIITQSNYIPWKGYFDGIALVDDFVIYDDMQYTKRDWRNRNLIKTPQGLKWLTIPVEVKGKYFQKINETKISNQNWVEDHLNQFKQHYKKAAFFNEVFPWMEDLYLNCKFDLLTHVNQYFLEEINQYLNIKTRFHRSEDFILMEDRTERLLNICINLEATHYVSGPAAKAYMNEALFEKNNIQINYLDYTGYNPYNQMYGDFEHGVPIFDLLLNEGKKSKHFLKFIQ